MNPSTRSWFGPLLGACGLAVALLPPTAATVASTDAPRVREPAVAGLFYPADPAVLSRTIDQLLAAAPTEAPPGELRALICPHAGYEFSGPVAATAFRLLAGRSYETVVVMGPSHYAALRAGSVTDAAIFRTPLGDVPVSPKAAALAGLAPFALEPNCRVERPDWAEGRPRPARETAGTWEHSVEVEVPFLQKTLTGFKLLPVVCGEFDEEQAARALRRILDDRTLIVVSSDLSHYNPYATARRLDQETVNEICRLNPDRIGDSDACGHTPIRVLLVLAKLQGWQARVLDLRNSGDITGNKAKGVVGYAAVAFYSPAAGGATAAPAPPPPTAAPAPSAAPAAAPAPAYSDIDRKYLLELARLTVRAVAATGRLPETPSAGLAPELTAPRGCFVTLTKHGALRGCIGNLTPEQPLVQAVIENARSAAVRDPRFDPVTAAEVDQLEIEISVLSVPKRLPFASADDLLRKLRPGIDGVVLQIGRHGATYLPQVWEQVPDKVEFLDTLSEKAGLPAAAWRGSDVTVFTYQVEAFKESKSGTAN